MPSKPDHSGIALSGGQGTVRADCACAGGGQFFAWTMLGGNDQPCFRGFSLARVVICGVQGVCKISGSAVWSMMIPKSGDCWMSPADMGLRPGVSYPKPQGEEGASRSSGMWMESLTVLSPTPHRSAGFFFIPFFRSKQKASHP